MKLDIDLIKRYFSGEYSRKDFLLIREAVSSEDLEHELRNYIRGHWDEFDASSLPDGDIEKLLHKVHHKIHLVQSHKSLKLTIWYYIQRIAALLFLPLALSFLYYYNIQSVRQVLADGIAEIQCPMGVRTKFSLPDGTTGYLNSGSILRYHPSFGESRQVELVGEAYFDVKKDDHSTFSVRTRGMYIDVLGTTFNVIAYPDEDTEEVILEGGALNIRGFDGDNKINMVPNQKVTFRIGAAGFIKDRVISSQYISWKEGKLVFRNETMEQVARRLSRWYNAEIIIADSELLHYSFYATFLDEPLDEVLKLLSLTAPIMFEEKSRVLSKDGMYSKRKITLKLNPGKLEQFK